MSIVHTDTTSPDPVDVLVEDSDPANRSRAHTALGLKAMQRDDVDGAVWHLREAIDLDPTDETPREALRALGQSGVNAAAHELGHSGVLARLWNGIRRRRTN